MSRTTTFSLTLAGMLFGLTAFAVAQPAAAPKPPDQSGVIVQGKAGQQADAIFTEATKDGGSGVVLLARGGQVLLQKGYGLANKEAQRPVLPDTAFCIGSNTKTYTAAAILKLEQMGKLRVEDPITKYIDGVPDDKKGLTLHHLLCHSSGLGEYHDRPGEGGDFAEMTRDEAVRRILAEPLRIVPGSKAAYSNCGYTLLAVVIEKVSGQPWEQFLREQLFQPAGMTHTGFFGEKLWNAEHVATGYGRRRLGDNTPRSWPGVTWALKGAGGIVSTVGDQNLWHQAMRGEAILTKASKEKAFKIHMPGPEGRAGEGYGWIVMRTPRETLALQHAGGSDFGFNAVMMSYPQEDVVIVIMTNQQIKNQRDALQRALQAAFAVD